jgi:hypothetical protein
MTLHIESERERAFARETLGEVIRKLEEALALQRSAEAQDGGPNE